ncbi:MAG: hypothetical protein IPG52_04550 [Rhodocyclaceae bacterium]|nr:hypothetical protein [Rhodocyclaceae bacterium]
MAVRIRSRFHTEGERSAAALASVAGILGWKLAIDAIKRMRQANYDIDIGRPYFDFVCEFLVFIVVAADRIAAIKLPPERRVEFTTALARRVADIVEENSDMLLDVAEPDSCRRHVIDLFNRRGGEYADFDYGVDGPDFGFKRLFAACLREGLPEKDRLWAIDQVMEIEVPEALKALEKTLAGLFGGGAQRARPDTAPGE